MPGPPPTVRDTVTETIHGVTIADPYRWLEDQNSPETRAWIAAQDAYSHSLLSEIAIRKSLETRLAALIKIDRFGEPTRRGSALFYSRQRVRDEQGILYTRDSPRGAARVLVDPNPLSKEHTTSAGIRAVSMDGALVAYSLRAGGNDQDEVHIMDVKSGNVLPDYLPTGFNEGFAFTGDHTGFYYVVLTPLKGRRLYYHKLGDPPGHDPEIFGAGTDAKDGIGADVSENGHWLTISVDHGWSRNDLYLKDLRADGAIYPVVKGFDATFGAGFAGDRLIVQTDYEAPTGRIIEIDPADPSPDRWRVIVPATQDAIEGYSLAGGKLFVRYLHDVHTVIKIYTLDGEFHGEIKLPGIGTASAPNGLWTSPDAYYGFSSFTTPHVIYHYNVQTGASTVWARPKVPVDASQFTTRQIWCTSRDGTRVPMFLIYKKGLRLDGTRPTLLTGYGGFDISLTPGFSSEATVWAEHGGVYAIANLRGGGEFGEAWHRAGMLANKQNVFDDFIAAAQWLVDNHVTNPDRLAIAGGSNGGLLVGVALTQRPDLFRAVLCEYPLLDMVRYDKFLQGPQWVPEYGSASNARQFKTLYAYSPYQHVRPGVRYPSVLFVTGDADTRVAPLHARKMTALLQADTGSDRPILLHYETTTGHSGGEPLSQIVKTIAREVGFLFWQLGVKD